MRTLFSTLVVLLLSASGAAAQHAGHGHAASAGAPVTLGAEERAGLLEGRGMGLARAAELNHYPGPKHLLEHADALALTPEQREAAEALMTRVQTEASALGRRIVALETQLDRLFASGAATDAAVAALVRDLGALRADLRLVHLQAHLDLRPHLTDAQVARYDALRRPGG